MIAVLTGDIEASRKLMNQEQWLVPLKDLLSTWGERSKTWDLSRGDYFQVEVKNPEEALLKALQIKALIKKVRPQDEQKKISTIDVRMGIGIGEKIYSGEVISESNGPAFVYSGEKFDGLKKENIKLGIKTAWGEFDEEMNLCFKLLGLFADSWSLSSAELAHYVLRHPNLTQEEIGKQLGIKQNSVSGRWNRAHIDELLAVERLFRKKIKALTK
ncbi:MAG: MarR family transcriptional regulator [Mongoliitalea sp.]